MSAVRRYLRERLKRMKLKAIAFMEWISPLSPETEKLLAEFQLRCERQAEEFKREMNAINKKSQQRHKKMRRKNRPSFSKRRL